MKTELYATIWQINIKVTDQRASVGPQTLAWLFIPALYLGLELFVSSNLCMGNIAQYININQHQLTRLTTLSSRFIDHQHIIWLTWTRTLKIILKLTLQFTRKSI